MGPTPKPLFETFCGPFTENTRLFNGDFASAAVLDLSAYVDYFNRQWNLIAQHSDGRYVMVRKPQDLEEIAHLVLRKEPRESILDLIRGQNIGQTNDETISNSLNLTTRVLSMLKCGTVRHQANPRGYLDWKAGSLHDFITEYFQQQQVLSCEGVRLPKAFDVWSVSVVGGIEIEFTDNLADHLLFLGDCKVLIFHHATFLESQQR